MAARTGASAFTTCVGPMSLREGHEVNVAAAALDQGDDCRSCSGAHDEVSLPVTEPAPRLDHLGTVVDQLVGLDEPDLPPVGTPAAFP